jgi:coenzyme F420-0:L-glutamate ligase/coenzyme F420-1:gamma-L-glutamate ligase
VNPILITPVPGIPEIEPGDDIAAAVLSAVDAVNGLRLESGDILVITHKIVSKAEGRVIDAGDDETYRAAVAAEADAVIRRRGDLIIARTRHGFICANAGVDRSNVRDNRAVLLPIDPDRSAHSIRMRISQESGFDIPVIISDTFGRPWRRGQTDVAIGVSGLDPIDDLRGVPDANGRIMEATEVAIVDEIAAAADLAMGKSTQIPVAIVRGVVWRPGTGRARDMVRPEDEDLFR